MPISMIYHDFMRFRRFLFKIGIYKQHKLAVPVIVVGNITVGGTGKTPLIIWLAQFLQTQGYKPGIISRGYGGESEILPQWIDEHSQATQVGDEAILIKQHSHCPIAVAPKRVKAAHMLLDRSDCNIILADDGLQHYALMRDIEIAVIDGERRFGNGYLLPCGPLREPIDRLQKVDLLIVNGVPEADNEFAMTVSGDTAIHLISQQKKPLSAFSQQSCHAVAGIGNPKRFFDLLTQADIVVDAHAFPDHHQFNVADITFADDKSVLMTEKDAVKCRGFASDNHWYIPVKAQPESQFVDKLLHLLKQMKAHG